MKIFFLAVLLLVNCTNQNEILKSDTNAVPDSKQEIASPSIEINTQLAVEKVSDAKKYETSLDKTKGLLTLSEEYKKPDDFIRFYNADGSLWYEFTFYYDDSDGKYEYENDNFRPFSFHPDYFTLALKLIGEKSNYYEVVVNEETKLKKYIKKNDKNLKFETWENHILKTFAIEFNQKENPIRETPNGTLKKVDLSKIERFGAVEFKGEWLKINWDTEKNTDSDSKKTDFGWIKWKEGENLLIDWFYFAWIKTWIWK